MADGNDILRAVSKRRLGHQLGSFRLDDIVGVGAITTVYVGVRGDGAKGAVRVLHPEVAALPDALEIFFRGAREANRVGHAGAVRVIETGEESHQPFVVMALLEGQSAADRAAARGGWLWGADVVRIADAALETLGHAHRRGIVHGDLQPHNLRLTPRGVRLLDFGISPLRRLAVARGLAAHAARDASAAWLEGEPNAERDLAALGASMAALLAGVPLPEPGTQVELGLEIDPALAGLVQHALAGGFDNAAQMRAELATVAAQLVPDGGSRAPVRAAEPAAPHAGSAAKPVVPDAGSSPAPPRPSRTAPASAAPRAPSAPEHDVVPLELDIAAPAAPVVAAPRRAPTPPSLEFDLAEAISTPAAHAPAAPEPLAIELETVPRTPSAAPRPSAPPPKTPLPPPPRVAGAPIAARAQRAGPTEGQAADVTTSRALFGLVPRCVSCGAAAIVEALEYEATPAPPGEEAQAAREAARPEAGRWLLRALETAGAAIGAGEGAITWQVGPKSFDLRGQPVWQPHGPQERIPARLHASGVRSISFRRGLMLPELGEVMRVFAAVADVDPRLDDDLAGVLWEAALPNVVVEADDDPLGAIDGDDGAELAAERAQQIAALRTWDLKALTAQFAQLAGQGDAFRPLHERLIDVLTALPADALRRSEAEQIFGQHGALEMAIPREEAMHIEAETRRIMLLDLDVDPIAAIERSAVAAARAWEANGPPMAAALRSAVDELSRAEPLAALALVHVACGAIVPSGKVDQDAPLTFELAVDLGGGGGSSAPDGPEDERRCHLARAIVSPEAFERILSSAPPRGTRAQHGLTPAAAMAGRVRDLVARLGEGALPASLQAYAHVPVPEVRAEIGRTLTRAGETAVGPIAALIPAIAVEPAVELIRVLATIGTRHALDAIGSGAESPHALVRIEALSHTEGASSERLRKELDKLLDDPEPGVRLAALRAMADNHIKVAGPHLALLSKDDSLDRRSLDERRAMLTTLAVLLPSRAESICMEQVQKNPLIPSFTREETRLLAAEVLGEIGSSPEVARALLEVAGKRFRNTEKVRSAARAAAERITARLATPAPAGPQAAPRAPEGGPR